MKKIILAIIVGGLLASSFTIAHSGRTDKNGCYMDRKAGTKHCH